MRDIAVGGRRCTAGVTMELPDMGAAVPEKHESAPQPANSEPTPEAADTEPAQTIPESPKAEKVKEAVKEKAQKAKKEAKKTAEKVKKAAKEVADETKQTAETVAGEVKKGGSKAWLYIVIGVAAAAVILVVAYLAITFEPKGSDENPSVLVAASDDTIFLVDGDTLTELAEVPEDVSARDIIIAADAKTFFVVADAEYDEDSGEYLGDLLEVKSNGKSEDIDEDVVVDSLEMAGSILWYEKADGEDKIICCYDGKEALEVIDEENISTWLGTDKAGKAFYTIYDDEDYTREAFIAENGDSDSLMDESEVILLSKDYKKAIIVTQDDEDMIVSIFDGKDDFEVMENVEDVVVNIVTFDMIAIADAEDMVLYYIPYGKDAIEIDDEVEEIFMMPNLYANYMVEDLGSMIYYGKDDDLYAADFKGKDTERVLKNYDELNIISQPAGAKEMMYVDDDEVVWMNIANFKEESVKLPDADKLTSSDVRLVGDWFVYRTEDNESLYAFDGRREPVELYDDAEEITGFTGFMDKYVIWKNVDDELILSPLKEDAGEEIGDDVYTYWVTEGGSIYYLSDYDDGGGDLYFISRVGKDAERIEKDIATLFRLYYE